MAIRRPMVRQPWQRVAWLLLAVAFGFAVFEIFSVAVPVFAASVACHIVALRNPKQPSGSDRHATQDPRQ